MSNTYKSALDAARKEYETLLLERQEMDQRILRLKQTIDGLSALCESDEDADAIVDVEPGLAPGYSIGLTDAIRSILETNSNDVLNAKEVRVILENMGVDMKKKYVQPMVPVHNTLKRLEKQGEIVSLKDDRGNVVGYRWVTPIARAMANVESSARLAGGTGRFVRAIRASMEKDELAPKKKHE